VDADRDQTPEPAPTLRPFASVPDLPPLRPTSPATLGRLVVAVVIASVAAIAATAWAIGSHLSFDRQLAR